MRAAIYCRISQDSVTLRDDQRELSRAGVTRQEEDCRALAESLKWEVHDVYTDNDVSATSGKPRPEYRRMLEAIKQDDVQALIAWHPDRLYRRMLDLEELIKVIDGHHVTVRTVTAGELDLSTTSGKMVARILGAVAQQEVEHKSDRWKRGYQQKREQGLPPPSRSRMFGWTRDGQVVESEAVAVRFMARYVREGGTVAGLCRELGQRGVRTSEGAAWRPNSVRRLLSNPRLAGHATLKGEIVGTGQWPPVLDHETWEVVRALVTSPPSGRSTPRVSLLVGLIWCDCGTRMVTSGVAGRRVYRCPIVPPYEGCGRKVSALGVEEVVETYAKAKLADPRVAAALARRHGHAAGPIVAEIDLLTDQLRQLEAALPEAGRSVPAVMRAIGTVRDQIDAKRSQLQAVAATPTVPVSGEWPAELERRRALVELVVERVCVGPSATPGRFDPERVRIDPR